MHIKEEKRHLLLVFLTQNNIRTIEVWLEYRYMLNIFAEMSSKKATGDFSVTDKYNT